MKSKVDIMGILKDKRENALKLYENNKNTSQSSYFMGCADMVEEILKSLEEFIKKNDEDEFVDIEETSFEPFTSDICVSELCDVVSFRTKILEKRVNDIIKNQKLIIEKLKNE
jgi:hypothetical protein